MKTTTTLILTARVVMNLMLGSGSAVAQGLEPVRADVEASRQVVVGQIQFGSSHAYARPITVAWPSARGS